MPLPQKNGGNAARLSQEAIQPAFSRGRRACVVRQLWFMVNLEQNRRSRNLLEGLFRRGFGLSPRGGGLDCLRFIRIGGIQLELGF